MATVLDPNTGRYTPVQACKSCGKAVYWGYTVNGKRCPYDLTEDGKPSDKSHFLSCPDASTWSKRK